MDAELTGTKELGTCSTVPEKFKKSKKPNLSQGKVKLLGIDHKIPHYKISLRGILNTTIPNKHP